MDQINWTMDQLIFFHIKKKKKIIINEQKNKNTKGKKYKVNFF